MTSPALVLTAIATAFVVAVVAYAGPAALPAGDAYSAIVRMTSGAVAIVGSLSLTTAIGGTFLRSGGTVSFKASYIAAAALGGLGVAEISSALMPANMGFVLAAYCGISIISGAFWVKFYGRAA